MTLRIEEKKRGAGGKFLLGTPVDFSSKVESGLEYILGHLSGPQFPRTVMTAISKGQREIKYKEDVMLYYQGSLWQDCRISAFYPGQKNPDLIFIDLDRKDFCSERAFKTALTKILKRIKKKIGGHPLAYDSGNGVHIVQPINCNVDLDTVKELSLLVKDKDVNKAFLQFASKYLSNDKRDKYNHTSLRSCQLRIIGSINSKCKKEVITLQEWDGFRPDFKLMLGSFYSYLVDLRQKEEQERAKYAAKFGDTAAINNGQVIPWIEKLLDTPLTDYRQCARDLIIIPYLMVRRGLTDFDEIEAIVTRWANKCHELEPLNPSYYKFERAARRRIYKVSHDMIPPMRFDKLQEENPELAKRLTHSH